MRPLKNWSWLDDKLSGKDLPFTCSAPLRGTKVELDCEGLPNDTKITVGRSEHKASGKWHLAVELGEVLGALSVKDVMSPGFELDPKTPLVIRIPSGTVTTELPKIKYLRMGIEGGVGKPMTFGNEPPATPNPAGPTVVWLGTEGESFGPATTMREVDWVAGIGDPKYTDGPTCKYQDRQTGKISSAPLVVQATEIVIYDRRSARVIDRNVMKPYVACPVEKPKEQEKVYAAIGQDAIKRWLKERRAKK